MSRRRTWLVALTTIVLLALAPIAFAAWVGQRPAEWLPTPLVTFAFDVRLATAPLAKKIVSLSRGSISEKRIYLSLAGRELRFESGAVELAGTLYGTGRGEAKRPGVLLLHGSTPEGRRMGLYRIIADGLAEAGYVVLTIDQRGFGQSAPVNEPFDPKAYDFVGDATRALSYLAAHPEVDSTRVHVIGHSFGVGVALSAGLLHSLARSIVVIGPGAPGPPELPAKAPPTDVRAASTATAASPPAGPAAPIRQVPRTRNYMARRALRYGSTVWIPGIDYIGQPISMEELAATRLALPDHKPLLVVSDAFEDPGTHAALKLWSRELAGPNRLVIAQYADHYFNTAGWGPLVVYDQRAAAELLVEVDAWLGRSPAGCSLEIDCAWPGVSALRLLVTMMILISLLVAAWILYRARSFQRSA